MDTLNKFGVGVQGEHIIISFPKAVLTKAEALNLAAYLVLLVDDNNEFEQLLKETANA